MNSKTIQWVDNTETEYKEIIVELSKCQRTIFDTMKKIDQMDPNVWYFRRKMMNKFDFNSRNSIAVNRAFYKLWEMISTGFPEPKRTLHFAEAPGSFVQVVQTKWKDVPSIAVSKAPNISDNRIPKFSPTVLKYSNCKFIYTDIVKSGNLVEISKYDKFDFITADGGLDEDGKYLEKESLHYQLIISQVIGILITQSVSGNCILKVFDTFTETSISIMWLLCQHYQSYQLIKPSTSRPTNSEKYIICKGFKGELFKTQSLLSLLNKDITSGVKLSIHVPMPFVKYVYDFSKRTTGLQVAAIRHVLKSTDDQNWSELSNEKNATFSKWKAEYKFDI